MRGRRPPHGSLIGRWGVELEPPMERTPAPDQCQRMPHSAVYDLAVSVTLELRRAFGLEGGDSFAVILGTRRHAHGASDRL